MLSIIKQRKIWYTISIALAVGGLIAIALFGLKLGIDFQGGSLLEIEFNQAVKRPTPDVITQALTTLQLNSAVAQPVGESGMIIRFPSVDEKTHQQVLDTINHLYDDQKLTSPAVEEKQFVSVGSSIGQELKTKTIWAIVIVLVAIIIYIAWAFRKVAKPVASWKYGVIASAALFHDVIITVGAFALLGKLYGTEINAPFVAAVLTVLGYSVNDTIVVFDRTRENLTKNPGVDFAGVVQKSIDEVIVRSINTSTTALLALFAILLLGGNSVRDFVLALIIGIIAGTYSSIFLASPLLVTWEKLQSKK